MGAYGDPVAHTPNLDHLAAKSTRFTAAYCTNPVCTPSRASIMTGLYSHHLEAQDNTTPYRPEHKTVAHHFNAAGYMTGLIGKMHWVDAQSHGFEYHLEFNDWFQYLGPKAQLYADELGRETQARGYRRLTTFGEKKAIPGRVIDISTIVKVLLLSGVSQRYRKKIISITSSRESRCVS